MHLYISVYMYAPSHTHTHTHTHGVYTHTRRETTDAAIGCSRPQINSLCCRKAIVSKQAVEQHVITQLHNGHQVVVHGVFENAFRQAENVNAALRVLLPASNEFEHKFDVGLYARSKRSYLIVWTWHTDGFPHAICVQVRVIKVSASSAIVHARPRIAGVAKLLRGVASI